MIYTTLSSKTVTIERKTLKGKVRTSLNREVGRSVSQSVSQSGGFSGSADTIPSRCKRRKNTARRTNGNKRISVRWKNFHTRMCLLQFARFSRRNPRSGNPMMASHLDSADQEKPPSYLLLVPVPVLLLLLFFFFLFFFFSLFFFTNTTSAAFPASANP